jgi:glycosyltransferase involved in cell wall biosynthesis
MKLVVMLRVKDGILFIRDWLEQMSSLADEVVVVDNGSTDGTLQILQRSPIVVSIDQTHGFDEGRDKILAYRRARERNADWILWLDVDEVFEKRLTRERLERMMASRVFTKYWFRRFHLHQDEQHFEAALRNIYSISCHDRVLWRDGQTGYFENRRIHNGLISGIRGLSWFTHYRLMHRGALDRHYLKTKTERYLAVDPSNSQMYIRHRDQILPTWRWYEYSERPRVVLLEAVLLDVLLVFRSILRLLTRGLRFIAY